MQVMQLEQPHALISSKKQKKHTKTHYLSVKCQQRTSALPLSSKWNDWTYGMHSKLQSTLPTR